MLNKKQVKAVRALARLGSFREAAESISFSPASFSRTIQQAERDLGIHLFERRRNGARLTAAGRDVLGLLEELDNAVGSFEAGVERLRQNGGERLVIACGPLTSRTLVMPVMKELIARNIGIRCAVRVDATKAPLEALRRGDIDVAVCDLTHTANLSDLEIRVLDRRDVVFSAPIDHPIHDQGPVDLADVLRLPLATPYLHNHWRATIAKVLGDDQDAWETVRQMPVVESDDYAFLVDTAFNGGLICGGMAETFHEYEDLGLLKRLSIRQQMQWNICAARRKNWSFETLEAFWDALLRHDGKRKASC